MIKSRAARLVDVCRVEELLIDSTFNTNKQSLELFSIIG